MKRKLRNKARIERLRNRGSLLRSAFLMLMLTFAACTNRESAHEPDSYTCPMHPSVIADHPGKCPVCGMPLVLKSKPGQAVEMTNELSRLAKPTNEVVVATISTIKPAYKSQTVSIPAQGVVTYDPRKIFTIAARVSGRLERVYLKYVFQEIARGQVIAKIYSPELITAEREFLFLMENDPENTSLLTSARSKLLRLGLTANQIGELIARNEATSTINIISPYSGYLINAVSAPPVTGSAQPGLSTTGDMDAGMASPSLPDSKAAKSMQPEAEAFLREGDYVTAGQRLFTVVTDDGLRVELDLPGTYNGVVAVGNQVRLAIDKERTHVGTVDFVQPFFNREQDFVKIRVYIQKADGFRIGRLINAIIEFNSAENLWVPKEAVLDLGTRHVAFLKSGDVFKPKEVVTGLSANGAIEIRSGLASSDDIAANAQFLVGSESFVKPLK